MERFLYNRADWKNFYIDSETAFDEITIENSNFLNTYNQFCKTMNILKEKYVPKLKKNTTFIKKKPVPWWDDDCEEVVKKSKLALNFYRSHPTIHNYIEYKKNDALNKRLLCEKKKKQLVKIMRVL